MGTLQRNQGRKHRGTPLWLFLWNELNPRVRGPELLSSAVGGFHVNKLSLIHLFRVDVFGTSTTQRESTMGCNPFVSFRFGPKAKNLRRKVIGRAGSIKVTCGTKSESRVRNMRFSSPVLYVSG